MKTLLLLVSLLMSILTFGQIQKGGQRLCGNAFTTYTIKGMTFIEALDFAGQTHNEYQEYLLNELSIIKPDFKDTSTLKRIISGKSTDFFSTKGLKYDEYFHTLDLAKPVTLEEEKNDNTLSSEANTLVNQFQGLLRSYDVKNDEFFFNDLNSLNENALKLSDETEVFKVGVPISIAIHSYEYWKLNGQRWMNIFGNRMDTDDPGKGPYLTILGNENFTLKPINLWKLGGADAAGAIHGAIAGSVAGPGGALAGGILTSACASLGNLVNQVIGSYISWWPF